MFNRKNALILYMIRQVKCSLKCASMLRSNFFASQLFDCLFGPIEFVSKDSVAIIGVKKEHTYHPKQPCRSFAKRRAQCEELHHGTAL